MQYDQSPQCETCPLAAGVLEVAVAMAEVGKRHRQAAKDAVAARRQLQAEAGKGIVLPSGVMLPNFLILSSIYVCFTCMIGSLGIVF